MSLLVLSTLLHPFVLIIRPPPPRKQWEVHSIGENLEVQRGEVTEQR